MEILCFFCIVILIIMTSCLIGSVKHLAKKEETHFKQLEQRIASMQRQIFADSHTSAPPVGESQKADNAAPETVPPHHQPAPAVVQPLAISPVPEKTPVEKTLSPTPSVQNEKAAALSGQSTSSSNQESAPTPQIPRKAAAPTFLNNINGQLRKQTETIEERTMQVLRKVWQWIVVGEEYRLGNVSKEYAVATTWLLRAAVLLIVFGISYFIKYSHDNNLFTPEIRLSCAALFAIALMTVGCKLLHGKYRMIGIALSGCSFAGLYLCVYASVGIYHLLPPLVGLGGMVVLTIAGVLLALRHDTLLLAVFALSGGYLAPVLMSTGSRDLVGFYSYLLILTAGSLFIARYRTWTFLNILSFLSVWILYYISDPFLASKGSDPQIFHYLVGLLFGFAFFLAFSLQTVLFNLFTARKITLIEIIMTALNGIIFLIGPLEETIERYGKTYASLLTFVLALYYLLQIALLRKSGMKDKVLLLTLLVFSSALIALTLPLLLDRDYWSAAWSIQAIAMLYIACRAQSRGLACLSYLVFLAAGIRLMFFDLVSSYFQTRMHFADRITDFGSYTLALIGGYFTLKRYPLPLKPVREGAPPSSSDSSFIMKALFWSGFFVSFILFFGESHHLASAHFRFFCMSLVSSVYLVLLVGLVTLFHGTGKGANIVSVLFGCIFWCFTLVMFIGRFSSSDSFYFLRVAEYILLTGILLVAGRINLFNTAPNRRIEKCFLISALCFWFLYSTMELRTISIEYGWKAGGKIAISALWGIYAFFLLQFGIRKSQETLRYIALTLFAVTVVKILLLDLAFAPALYRIGGCFAVGVILVASAWIYMKSGRNPLGTHKE